jgi:hypothetical protein
VPAHGRASISQSLELVAFDPAAELSGRSNTSGNLADGTGHSCDPGHLEFLETARVVGAGVTDHA